MFMQEIQKTFKTEVFGETYMLHLAFSTYQNSGARALQAFSESDWGLEPFATLSVNMPEAPQDTFCFWCKDWSENEWVPAFLEEHKIATPTGRSQASGFVAAAEFRLSPEIIKELSNDQNA